MHSFFFSKSMRNWYPYIIIIAVWLLGFLFGFILARCAGPFTFSLMHSSLSASVSIVSLLCVVYVPFSTYVVLSAYRKCGFLYLFSFLDCLIYSFTGLLLRNSFGSSGWLVQLFLQFPQSMLLPVSFWFLLRRLSGQACSLLRDSIIFLVISAIVVSVYLITIIPFWNTLMEQYT